MAEPGRTRGRGAGAGRGRAGAAGRADGRRLELFAYGAGCRKAGRPDGDGHFVRRGLRPARNAAVF